MGNEAGIELIAERKFIKGTPPQDFYFPPLFHKANSSGPLQYFRMWLRFRGEIQIENIALKQSTLKIMIFFKV